MKRFILFASFIGFWTTASYAIRRESFPEFLPETLPRSMINGCIQIFQNHLEVNPSHIESSKKIENLEELVEAFSHGLLPDLSDTAQRDAFEMYRQMRFGNPDTILNPGILDEVAEILKENPQLQKETFRDYRLQAQQRIYPVTAELESYLNAQVMSAAQTRSNLFQVEANSGYWKKILQFEERETEVAKSLDRYTSTEQKVQFREKKKNQKEQMRSKWNVFLDERISAEVREKLADSKRPAAERAEMLFRILESERKRLFSERKDVQPVSQAMIDVIHTIGYHDPNLIQAFKSSSGMERINAYRKILNERDRFAMQLGFVDHFQQVFQQIGRPAGVVSPSGVPSQGEATEVLKKIEEDVVAKSQKSQNSNSIRRVRHLSLVESPFRSCVGGSDCSSRSYFTRALDPNYHYFTLTDETGISSGQITIVLGEAELDHKKVKMAFVDKVQNVPNIDLPRMLEAMRRSIGEKGYILALPEEMGDHNGISNEELIRHFISKNIEVDRSQKLLKFKPHRHSYSFANAYSRAEDSLLSYPIEPLSNNAAYFDDIEISPGEIYSSWKIEKIDIQKLAGASIRLKNSPYLEEKLRYIPAMNVLANISSHAHLKKDPDFNQTLLSWISDPNQPYQLRKQVLIYQWSERFEPLPDVLQYFNENEQIQIVQNLLDTPRFRDWMFEENEYLPNLLVSVRRSKKLRAIFMADYLGVRKDVLEPEIDRILDAKDLSQEQALELVQQVKASFGSHEIEEVRKIQKLVQGTSLSEWFDEVILKRFVLDLNGEESLGRAVSHCFNSTDSTLHHFGIKLMAYAEKTSFSQSAVIKAFREILSSSSIQRETEEFQSAALAWIKAPTVVPEIKYEFLISNLQNFSESGESLYRKYQAAMPRNQRDMVDKKLKENTYLGLFERIDESRSFYRHAKLESFEFRPYRFGGQGERVRLGSPIEELGRHKSGEEQYEAILTRSFELQATPVTQLQWALVMGSNPSRFTSDGITQDKLINSGQVDKADGTGILINPYRPVEQVTWDDVQKFIEKLNQMDPDYVYRLPTEAEWEYAARAGTQTAYSFGNDPEQLGRYGWYLKNSGNQTHDVASLQPNLHRLYDMHGNVWEWVQDWWQRDHPNSAIDPQGARFGNLRVLKGGSWQSLEFKLRSAMRTELHPALRGIDIGFRLARTRK